MTAETIDVSRRLACIPTPIKKERRMRHGSLALLIGIILYGNALHAADVLIQNAQVYDGTGKPPFTADVRVHEGRITAVGRHLVPVPGETARDAHGLALAPGFIDMHTHADRGLLKDLDAATVSRQGVTTIFIGQDGQSHFPLRDYYEQLKKTPPAINVASMIGHATYFVEGLQSASNQEHLRCGKDNRQRADLLCLLSLETVANDTLRESNRWRWSTSSRLHPTTSAQVGNDR